MLKMLLALIAICFGANAEAKLDFTEDAMCIPAGDKIWLKLGINSNISEYITTKNISIGPAKIPKGCKITFGYSSELTSSDSPKEIAEKRIVAAISDCEFKMAGVPLIQGLFDLDGCMDGFQLVASKKKLCKGANPSHDSGHYYFDNGFLRCDRKVEPHPKSQ